MAVSKPEADDLFGGKDQRWSLKRYGYPGPYARLAHHRCSDQGDDGQYSGIICAAQSIYLVQERAWAISG